MWYSVVIAALASYLLGNLNGAVSMSILLAHDDVRSHGSGNAGFTNFVRNFGIGKGVLVMLIDAGKAVLACLLGGQLLAPYGYRLEGMMLGAVAVSLGHDFPATLGFKGGKGILCGAAVAFTVDWRVGLIAAALFFGLYFLTGYVSLGSLVASIAFGVGFAVFNLGNVWVMAAGIFMALLAIFMHRENIKRLLTGTERKSNLFSKAKKEE